MKQLQDIDFSSATNSPWLSAIGKHFSPPSGFKFIQDLQEVNTIMCSDHYEDFQTQKQGDLSEFLSINHRQEFQKWNENCLYIKDQMSVPFENLSSIVSDLGLDSMVTASIRWDILHGYQEQIYSDYKIPIYFSNLFPIYEAGHIVCGYEETPKGINILVH